MFHKQFRTAIPVEIDDQVDSFLVDRDASGIANEQDQEANQPTELVYFSTLDLRVELDVDIGTLVSTLTIDVDIATTYKTQSFLV